jgi:hypothetical protein
MTKKENASGAFLPLVLLFRNDLLISPQVFGEGPDFSTAPLCRIWVALRVSASRQAREAIRPSVPQFEAVKPREAPDNWDTGAVDD